MHVQDMVVKYLKWDTLRDIHSRPPSLLKLLNSEKQVHIIFRTLACCNYFRLYATMNLGFTTLNCIVLCWIVLFYVALHSTPREGHVCGLSSLVIEAHKHLNTTTTRATILQILLLQKAHITIEWVTTYTRDTFHIEFCAPYNNGKTIGA